jgi:AcrR family transcriptional regulator
METGTQKKMDERYRIVEEAIFGAFERLAREKEVGKITVSDVIRQAGIARGSFYNHYKDMPSLLAAMEDRTLREIREMLQSFHPNGHRQDCEMFFLSTCHYIEEHPYLATVITSVNAESYIRKALLLFHHYVPVATKNLLQNAESATLLNYNIAYAIGGIMGILHRWTSGNFKEPAEEVARIAANAYLFGMAPYYKAVKFQTAVSEQKQKEDV